MCELLKQIVFEVQTYSLSCYLPNIGSLFTAGSLFLNGTTNLGDI